MASLLGVFTTIFNDFSPPGDTGYTLTGMETLVAANRDELVGTVNGTGTFARDVSHGTDLVTITGGTGRFANAWVVYRDVHGPNDWVGAHPGQHPAHRSPWTTAWRSGWEWAATRYRRT